MCTGNCNRHTAFMLPAIKPSCFVARGRYLVKSTEEDIAALVNRMVLTGEDVDKLAQRSRAEVGAAPGAKSRHARAPMCPCKL